MFNPDAVKLLDSLPLSEQLRIAVVDLRRAIRNPLMELDMLEWVRSNGKCSVCLAGAVMYYRGGIGKNFKGRFDAYAIIPQFAMNINAMRGGGLPGHLLIGLSVARKIELRLEFSDIVQETYDNGILRAQLKTYLKAATYLESKGL
jgi:hypothetical protein